MKYEGYKLSHGVGGRCAYKHDAARINGHRFCHTMYYHIPQNADGTIKAAGDKYDSINGTTAAVNHNDIDQCCYFCVVKGGRVRSKDMKTYYYNELPYLYYGWKLITEEEVAALPHDTEWDDKVYYHDKR